MLIRVCSKNRNVKESITSDFADIFLTTLVYEDIVWDENDTC